MELDVRKEFKRFAVQYWGQRVGMNMPGGSGRYPINEATINT